MNGSRPTIALLVTALTCAVLPAPAADPAFSDRSVEAGLDHFTGLFFDTQAQGMFPGGAVGDFNRDGWPDVFLIGGGNIEDGLYINNGDGTFTDRAFDWGVDALHRGRGATAGDYDGDGWDDLFVTSSGPVTGPATVGVHKLYRNNGDGTFTDVAVAAGVNEASPTNTIATGSAFGDYDLDGDLDLFVCTWEGYDGNRLFRNEGDGTFTDVTTAAGIDQAFHGFSPRFVDMNGDRYPELLVAADYVTSRYFVNDGDGTFTDATVASGTGLEDNGMGTTVADFDRDGLPDWYVTSIYDPDTVYDGNYLYHNQGNDLFVDLPESAGAKDGGWGWGTEAVDVDHDGFVDLVETNGWASIEYESERTYLYRNNGDLTFTEVGVAAGFVHVSQGRSAMTLDYDRDGDMDVVLTSYNDDVKLFRNDVSGPDAHWIELFLDTSAHADLAPGGYGSKVVVTTGGVSQSVWVNGGASYLGRSQLVAHFGIGAATSIDELRVEWANGAITTLVDVPADQILTITPESGGAPGAPGEAAPPSSPMTAGWNGTTGEVEIAYTPACDATDHIIYYGDLANVASYTYTGAACGVGTSGTASFDPGADDVFFVIVGVGAAAEGSYGLDGAGLERPEDIATPGCDLDQDLSGTCGTP
jgi:hypothetical protein